MNSTNLLIRTPRHQALSFGKHLLSESVCPRPSIPFPPATPLFPPSDPRNPLFPALRSGPTAVSGASRQKQTPSSKPSSTRSTCYSGIIAGSLRVLRNAMRAFLSASDRLRPVGCLARFGSRVELRLKPSL